MRNLQIDVISGSDKSEKSDRSRYSRRSSNLRPGRRSDRSKHSERSTRSAFAKAGHRSDAEQLNAVNFYNHDMNDNEAPETSRFSQASLLESDRVRIGNISYQHN